MGGNRTSTEKMERDTYKKILGALEEKPMTRLELADKVKIPETTVSARVSELFKQGRLEVIGYRFGRFNRKIQVITIKK